MSLVGTRPILQDELQKYELHHRARIAIKPGITGMWQVSGRSDITDFEEVVRLDTEYMSDIHPVNNTVKYIDKLRGHRRDGKLEHQSAYGCLAKICCCVHFNFPHPFDRDCRICICSSPCY